MGFDAVISKGTFWASARSTSRKSTANPASERAESGALRQAMVAKWPGETAE
jgi:hypothetical protein